MKKGSYQKSKSKYGKIVKTYDYEEIDGKLKYQAVRLEPKGFYQRRSYNKELDDKLGHTVKDGIVYDKKGKRIGKLPWVNSLVGIKPLLYHLPQLLRSKGRVLLPEGEKDCDNLRALNFNATTNPMGCLKWRKSYNQYLKDRDIVIIPDFDPKEDYIGDRHARQVAQSLQGIAKSIKLLELRKRDKPEEREADISTWIEHSPDKTETKNELAHLITKAPEYKAEAEPEPEPKPEKIDQDKIKHRHLTLIPDLIHLIKDGTVKYLLKNEGGNLYIKRELIRDSFFDNGDLNKRIIYTPAQNLPIGITTPEILELQGKVDFGKLLEEVIDYIRQRLELPEIPLYLVLALWTFHTYLIDKFNTTPILYVTGVKETGKGRLGEILRELAFRGQVLTTPTEASIFREAHYFRPALIVDEVKLSGFESNEPVASLVNNRYKRGVYVTRIAMDKQGEDQVEHYDVFGATVITTTESIKPTLRSRCIEFIMQKNQDPKVERPLDYEKAQELRDKLTCFRAKFIDLDLPPYEQIARGRLNEILLPLYQVLMLIKPDWQSEFKGIVKTLRTKKRTEEALSLEADIVQVIIDELGGRIGDLCILTKKITELINKDIGEKEKPISDRAIAFRCNRLGFERWQESGTRKRGFKIKRALIKNLADKYEIDYLEKPINSGSGT